jgi:hypothetical protein
VSLTLIHIGKTGGTYLKARLREASALGPTRIRTTGGHRMTLPRALREEPDTGIIFAIRDPFALFVSAFNSRQRQGQPRRFKEHSAAEATAFSRFSSPNELAVALGSSRPATNAAALEAMSAIYHLQRAYSWYLKSRTRLRRSADHIVFIFRTDTLDDDLREFSQRLEIPIRFPESATVVDRHAAPGGQSTRLSARGRTALREYWRLEFRLYNWSRRYREQILSEPPRLQGIVRP